MARTPGFLPQLSAGFFSLSPKAWGPDRSCYSPAVPSKIVYAGVANPSFANASENLLEVGDLVVSAKQVERVTKGIGLERTAERDRATAAYRDLPLVERKAVPPGVTAPSVGVVGTDGGRIQILDRGAAGESAVPAADAADAATAKASPPASEAASERGGRYWREDKIGVLMAMKSTVSVSDPCPRIPEGFLDPTRRGQLTRELRKGVAVAEEAADEAKDAAAEEQSSESRPAVWKPPEVQEKRLLGSRQNGESFGPMVAAAAWAMGLFGATRRGPYRRWSGDQLDGVAQLLLVVHADPGFHPRPILRLCGGARRQRQDAGLAALPGVDRLGLAGQGGWGDRGVAGAAGGTGRPPRGGQRNASTQGGGQDADLPGKPSEPDALRRVPPPGTADHFQLRGERRQAV
jgi:hypothetical protein